MFDLTATGTAYSFAAIKVKLKNTKKLIRIRIVS